MIKIVQGLVYICGAMLVATFGCLAYSIINVGNTMGTWVAMWQGFLAMLPLLLFIAACLLGASVGLVAGLIYMGRMYANEIDASGCPVDSSVDRSGIVNPDLDPNEMRQQ